MAELVALVVVVNVVGSISSTLGFSDQFANEWNRAVEDCGRFDNLVQDLNMTKEALGDLLKQIVSQHGQNGDEQEWWRVTLNGFLIDALRSVQEAQRLRMEKMPSFFRYGKRKEYYEKMQGIGKRLIKHNVKLQMALPYVCVSQNITGLSRRDGLVEGFARLEEKLEGFLDPSVPTSPTSVGIAESMDIEGDNISDVTMSFAATTLTTEIDGKPWKPRESTYDAIEEEITVILGQLEACEEKNDDEETSKILKSAMGSLAMCLPVDRPKLHETISLVRSPRTGRERTQELRVKLEEDWTWTEKDLENINFVVREEELFGQDRRSRARMSAVQEDMWKEVSVLSKLAKDEGRRDCLHRFLGYMELLEEDGSFTGYRLVFEPNPLGRLFELCNLNDRFAVLPGSSEYISTVLYEIFLGAARGLEAMHVYGILHRDVTPMNIYITACDDGLGLTAKLGNFGNAKDLESRVTHTALGDREDNPYIAPEAFSTNNSDLAKYEYPADYWSLGKCLEICAEQLFQNDPYEERRRALQSIITRCREPRQEDRYGRRTYHGRKLSKDLAEVRQKCGKEYTGLALRFVSRLQEVLARTH